MIIDWVRDTINAPAEELGPSQLAQRAVDLICNVAGDRVSLPDHQRRRSA